MHVVRAGIVVTGTEVLSGLIADANGPWLSERLREHGVTLTHTMVVGDRPEDLRAALGFLAGHGRRADRHQRRARARPPTTSRPQVVADFAGRAMALDPALEERVWAIVAAAAPRFPRADEEAMRAGARKQALVPAGATVLEPVGTAPGLIVPGDGGLVLVLPGPPARAAADVGAPRWRPSRCAGCWPGAGELEQRIIRMYGVPEAELAATLREIDRGPAAWRSRPACAAASSRSRPCSRPPPSRPTPRSRRILVGAFADAIFSFDGATIDEVVARAAAPGGRSPPPSRAPAA